MTSSFLPSKSCAPKAATVTAIMVLATSCAALAQPYPNRPITMVYPFPPAGTPVAFTTIFNEASKVLGQPIVVDYRPGAGNRFGATEVMKAKPDGYLLAAAPDSVLTVLPLMSTTFKAEPAKDYTPLVQMIEYFFVITAHPSMPFRDFPGLVAYAKANPGKLNFAGNEPGGVRHFLLERIKAATGMDMTNVPYKGDAQSLPDRLSGTTEIGISAAAFKPHIDAGKLVALATTGPARMKEFPNVPTLEEAGYKGFTMTSWFGLIAPAGTPADVIAKLNAAFNVGIKSPEAGKLLAQFGFEPVGGSSEQFMAKIRSDLATNAPVVRRLGLKVE